MGDSSQKSGSDRRGFLKIGGGLVAGAVVGAVGVAAYESSVIGANSNSSSSTVSSLQNQLSATQSQLNATQASLSDANNTIQSLNGALTSTQNALGQAQSSLSAANSQNSSLNSQNTSLNSQNSNLSSQLTATQQSLSNANSQIGNLQSQVSSATSQVSSLQSSLNNVQSNLDTQVAFLSLSSTEQVELSAISSSIIPTDSTGPVATTAGVVYFIDRQLKSAYGQSGLQYRAGPFVAANSSSPVTVDGITYSGGSVTYNNGPNTFTIKYPPTANVRVGAGTRFQYAFDMKEFWTIGLAGIQAYSNAAFGGNFETLSAANQTQVLTDLWNNKPTYDGASGSLTGGAASSNQVLINNVNSPAAGAPGGTQFGAVLPSDFAYELFFMVWNGFWMDPVYGGNLGMVGWKYIGFHGVNLGNFYGEGYTSKQLMLANTPITLQPASLGQFQKGSP